MPLSKQEVVTFVRSNVGSKLVNKKSPHAFYFQILQDIRESGFRTTHRVKRIVLYELDQIQSETQSAA